MVETTATRAEPMPATCLVAAPDARRVVSPRASWLLWGRPATGLERAVSDAGSVEDAIAGLASVAQDATAVRLGHDGTVDALRSVTATRDLYTLETADRFVVADSFRNALAELPVGDRRPAHNAVVDHLLFRHPPEPETYVAGIRALEHGTHLHRDPDGTQTVEVVDRLDARGARGGPPVDALDAALAEGLDGLADATTMLSGGVDSTLVHTYLDEAPSLLMAIDSPEFDFEVEYAREARDVLGVDGETVTVHEDAFLEALEASVDALGFPSHYNQTVLTDATFRRTDESTYVNAEGADSLYGLAGVKGARVAAWLSPAFAVPGGERLWRAGPGRAFPAARVLPDHVRRLHRDPADPGSFAQRLPFFTDPDLVGRITDPETVRERYARSLRYVTERVHRDAGRRGFAAQVELAHLLGYFRHNTVDQWRQLGYVHGHELVAPFKTRRVVDAALSMPAERRYVEGLASIRSRSAKYVPKRLLKRRLPGYPVYREKGAGSLPVERYVESGPLSDAFERYDPPAFVPDALRAAHVESFGPVTWNLLTWAVWRDRVLQNPAVERVAGTEEHVVER